MSKNEIFGLKYFHGIYFSENKIIFGLKYFHKLRIWVKIFPAECRNLN